MGLGPVEVGDLADALDVQVALVGRGHRREVALHLSATESLRRTLA